jgi:hypothetical protein
MERKAVTGENDEKENETEPEAKDDKEMVR